MVEPSSVMGRDPCASRLSPLPVPRRCRALTPAGRRRGCATQISLGTRFRGFTRKGIPVRAYQGSGGCQQIQSCLLEAREAVWDFWRLRHVKGGVAFRPKSPRPARPGPGAAGSRQPAPVAVSLEAPFLEHTKDAGRRCFFPRNFLRLDAPVGFVAPREIHAAAGLGLHWLRKPQTAADRDPT